MCGWVQDDKDDGDWIRNNLGTASFNTGPKSDHTTHADDLSKSDHTTHADDLSKSWVCLKLVKL